MVLSVVLLPFPSVGEGFTIVTSRGENIQLYRDYYALVVGVSSYDERPTLPLAVKSAREVATLLEQMGFKVDLLIDPKAQQLKKSLTDLVKGPGREPERGILIYYAGQGETQAMPDGARTGWLIPRDCPQYARDPKGFADRAISMKDITAYSVDIQSRHVLMLFDASISGASFSLAPPVLSAIQEKTISPVRQYFIAGREGEAVSEQGTIQRFLHKALEGDADAVADGYITGSELAVFLDYRIRAATGGKQHPQYGVIAVPALAGGDFIFKRIGGTTGAEPGLAKLTVKTDPEDATVSFLKNKQHFSQGMELKPGKYQLEVTARGYQPDRSSIIVAAGEDKTIDIQLKKIGNVTTNSIGMKFIFINPGTFEMGSSSEESGGNDDEQKHTVTLSKGYYLQTTEITVGQFRQFVSATGYITEAETAGGCWISSTGSGWKKKQGSSWKNSALPGATAKQVDQQPVSCVSWNDSQAFIKWLTKKEGKTYSLPTEAEWEYSCRAGSTTAFGYGECLSSDQANYGGIDPKFAVCKSRFRTNRKKPLNVASLAANPWGLFDMHGNVAEWCDDWYGPYPTSTARDPKGPSSGTDRVLRGCHWLNTAGECRSAKRSSFPPGYASDVVGFRLVTRP